MLHSAKRGFFGIWGICALLCVAVPAFGQLRKVERVWTLDLMLGKAGYLGDLSPQHRSSASAMFAGSKGYWGIAAQRRISAHFSATGSWVWSRLYGSDFQYGAPRSDQYLRNLHFRNDVLTWSAGIHWDVLPQRGSTAHRALLRPYATAGISLLKHKPEAKAPEAFGDVWIPLRELGTEGQLNNRGKTYSLWQPSFPLEFGVQVRLSDRVDLVPHFRFQFTFTDYLDDVGGAYVDAGLFDSSLAGAMADRSIELKAAEKNRPRHTDWATAMSYQGADGNTYTSLHGYPQNAMRGNPNNNDLYWMAGVKLRFFLSSVRKEDELSRLHRVYDPVSSKEKMRRIIPDAWVNSLDRHEVKRVAINTAYSEVVTSYFREGILFDSDRPDKDNVAGRRKGNVYNVYYAPFVDIMKNGVLTKPVAFEGERYQNHSLSHAYALRDTSWVMLAMFAPQGNIGATPVHKLYRANVRADRLWEEPEPLPFLHAGHSFSHPTLSADGRTMYLVSDMPGGHGGTDIYVAHQVNGEWTVPSNVGDVVNTAGNELYPFVHADGTLYFASDGHEGLGGLDVFETYRDEAGQFVAVKNVGMPINSKYNDFSLILDIVKRRGFFTSDRLEEHGRNDIYSFHAKSLSASRKLTSVQQLVLERTVTVEGIVVDLLTQRPIPNAYVTVKDMVNNAMWVERTDDVGVFSFEGSNDGRYSVACSALGYQHLDLLPLQDVGREDSHGNVEVRLEMQTNKQKLVLKGRVVAKATGLPIPGAKVRLEIEGEAEKTGTISVDSGGEYRFKLHRNLDYKLTVIQEGYLSITYEFSTYSRLFAETIVVNLELEKMAD